jgi:photosystem II stability/assembly factor-like uncharacterized protein
MKQAWLAKALVFLVAAGLAGCAGKSAASSAKGWTVVMQTGPVNEYSAYVAGFLDDHFGIIAGMRGEIHYTSDGGETWPRAENQSACRFGLDVVDENLAWTVGDYSHVRVSTDGGKSWKAVSNTPWKGVMVSFIDETTGWVANTDNLAATNDGGQTWTTIALPAGISKIVAATLRSAVDGYLLTNTGSLYTTPDGGIHWTERSLGLEKEVFSSESASTASVRFTDADNGIVVLGLIYSGGAMLALRTADGGTNWSRETLPVKLGAPFLKHDGTLLTVLGGNNLISVLRYLA